MDTSSGKVGAFDADPKSDDLCCVKLWRLGPYLLEADNGCGLGNNGTAGGVYRPAG